MEEHRLVTVARAADVPAGTVTTVVADGEPLALAHVGGEFYATQNACPHLQGPLGEGWVEDCVLTCPWHGWQFDLRTGENVFDLAIRLRRYEVRVEEGEVKVAV